jgi:hypothetical protein
MKKILLVTCLLILAYIINAQKVWVNKNYAINHNFKQIVLAPVFINSTANNQLNKIFYKIFSEKFTIADTAKILFNVQNDDKFYTQLNKTVYVGFDAKKIKANTNLFELLKKNEIENFQKNFLNSDLILICSSAIIKKVTKVNGQGNVSIKGSFIVFDLKTGELVMTVSAKNKELFKTQPQDNQSLIENFAQKICKELVVSLK